MEFRILRQELADKTSYIVYNVLWVREISAGGQRFSAKTEPRNPRGRDATMSSLAFRPRP
jgi:hypothetical protein